ncbi:unnamed protein product [Linum tenue]|uniref:Uncharacterized protein n=1 Tax=Linum tenue TaxID=586396 RepID=A0AAV0MS94_9ROSI|nr:unnamed protein product [Linum tenue]CAI0448966.1 unnamed protein product [Linum tenue]
MTWLRPTIPHALSVSLGIDR